MNVKTRQMMEKVEKLAESDRAYRQMMLDMRLIEKRYNSVLSKLSSEEQNAICDFVSQCEEMSFRMLELACGDANNTPPE